MTKQRERPVLSALEQQRARVHVLNDQSQRPGSYVLLWLQQVRRVAYSNVWQFACKRAQAAGVGLLVVEDLCAEQPWNQWRHFAFAAQGMRETADQLAATTVCYAPILPHTQNDLFASLIDFADGATEIVTDLQPLYVARQWTSELVHRLPECRLTAIDDCGLLPVNLLSQPMSAAAHFRRHYHRNAAEALRAAPVADPLQNWRQPPPKLSKKQQRWVATDLEMATLQGFPCDRSVTPIDGAGGRATALRQLAAFVEDGLPHYEQRSDVSRQYASALSPYLHWGQISVWDIFSAVLEREEQWNIEILTTSKQGGRYGFWPLSEPAQLFFDELISWRELSYSSAWLEKNFTEYGGLPEWARATLAAHAEDPRQYTYSLEQLAAGATHDPYWNAAQHQLRETGFLHNYMRMIWGKYVMLWQQPEEAWQSLVELNNRYALDGRNPNSWAGIGWVFGRYDHPWQERPVIGTTRAMGIAAAKRHGDVAAYLERYGDDAVVASRQGSLFHES